MYLVHEAPDSATVANPSDPRLAGLTIIDELAEKTQWQREGVASENLSSYGIDRITAEFGDVPYYEGEPGELDGYYVRSEGNVSRISLWVNV